MSVASSALLAGPRSERRRSGERLRKDSVIRTYQENGKTADERAELIDWRFEKLVSNEII